VRNISLPVDVSDLVKSFDFWGEPPVQAEDGAVDDSCDGEALEDLGEPFPDRVVAVFSQALVIETIQFIDLPVFVVSSEDGDSASVLDFEEENVEQGLDRVEAAIHIVAHEEVVGGLHKKKSTGSLPQI
jgi:hypothetical protein